MDYSGRKSAYIYFSENEIESNSRDFNKTIWQLSQQNAEEWEHHVMRCQSVTKTDILVQI